MSSRAFGLGGPASLLSVFAVLATIVLPAAAVAQDKPDPPQTDLPCAKTVRADVVALDQVLVWNKFGSHDPYGQIYALARDVVNPTDPELPPTKGNAMLRPDLRPRPLILRVNQGDCIEIRFTNLLDPNQFGDSPATRSASFHVTGLSYANIDADAAHVGNNASSLANPGDTKIYRYRADTPGIHLATSLGALAGGEGDGGSLAHGMFGGVVVEPPGSIWLDGRTGLPILDGDEIVNGTIAALITNVNEADDLVEHTQEGDFREFAILFHDEAKTRHADPRLDTEFWLHSVRDAFGINYGISGIGQTILDSLCAPDCRYEENFLTSWANGDPALLAHFPDDPSNVWHSYLGDNTKMRVMHVGPKETHIFHLHAHQWVYTEDEENSTYLDSQAIGPGSAFTAEIAYGGAGNRNMTPGDSIFHCHLYPHFAQGMWGLWRVHDVFEDGTRLLPDKTPIPRVAPLPGRPLPPLPSPDLPGYPMFIPGVPGEWGVAGFPGDYRPGHRPPQPPLDHAGERDFGTARSTTKDGGLGRHVFGNKELETGYAGLNIGTALPDTSHPANALGLALDGEFATGSLDDTTTVFPGEAMPDPALYDVIYLPYEGTDLEQAAMAFHARRDASTGVNGEWGGVDSIIWNDPTADPTPYDYDLTADGNPNSYGVFQVNGHEPARGAPFAEPCPTGTVNRWYKASVIDVELVINNTGWHDPQGRIYVLDGDVEATLNGTRPTEPFFIRANSNDCIEFQHTNLSAREMHEDDFQVQTPTDTIGQHIHLLKFDVLAADGSVNGWNYEDGTFSPQEIEDRLDAMGLPYAGGAQSTIQRWWADPLINGTGDDRTLRTIFTHDHYSPSTIQQHGAYAAVVVEPENSTWWNSFDGTQLGSRNNPAGDGGPTGWRADIHMDNGEAIREFCLAVADFAIVYDESGNPINPPRNEDGEITPEAISAADPGTMTMNYRNEPIPLRIGEPHPDGSAFTNQLRGGRDGRMPFVFDSSTHGDPATPLLSAYQGDEVQIRLVQGAQEDSHSFMINRLNWLREISVPGSGYVNAQHIGISEHFEFQTSAIALAPMEAKTKGGGKKGGAPSPSASPVGAKGASTDLLWSDTSEDGLWNGVWGIFRIYADKDARDPAGSSPRDKPDLLPLPNNQDGLIVADFSRFENTWPCPDDAPIRRYEVTAVLATDVLGPEGITYNTNVGGIFDDTGLMFVLEDQIVVDEDPLSPTYNQIVAAPGVTNEPLVIRARAGECLKIVLRNRLPDDRPLMPDNPLSDARMTPITDLNVHNMMPDTHVGFSIDLVKADANDGDGGNFGYNLNKTLDPGSTRELTYYCGRIESVPVGGGLSQVVAIPEAFGVCNIRSWGDVIKHNPQGLMGALIVEPADASWTSDTGTVATVTTSGGAFREFVLVQQDGLNLLQGGEGPITDVGDDPEDSGEKAYNYRTEPFWVTTKGTFEEPGDMNDRDLSNVLAIAPETPVFEANVGDTVVFRLCQPAGRARAHTFTVHGHHWPDEPDNPTSNVWGAQTAHTVGHGFNLWIDSAGGPAGVPGDYLFHEMSSFQFSQGLWGILRVNP